MRHKDYFPAGEGGRRRKGIDGQEAFVAKCNEIFLEIYRFVADVVGAVFIFFKKTVSNGFVRNRTDQFNAVDVFFQKADIHLPDFIKDRTLRDLITESLQGAHGGFEFFDQITDMVYF